MRKSDRIQNDDLRPEYDFATLPGGVHGKYVKRYRKGTNLALLEPDVAVAFPTDAAVNEALRVVMGAAATIPRARRLSNAGARRPRGGAVNAARR